MRPLSRGAERLLDRLFWYAARYRRIYPHQSKLADGLKVSSGTLRRWLLELKRAGLLIVRKCGRNAAEYELQEAAIGQRFAQINERSKSSLRTVDALSGHYSSSSSSISSRKPPCRKPPQMETYTEPPMQITSEAGRRDINPAWIEWRDRELRISRANNPAAYRAAISRSGS